MEPKIQTMHCEKCDTQYDVDLNKIPFQTSIVMLNRKTSETRSYVTQCPECQHLNLFTSDDPKQWGNQKSVNVRKVKWLFGSSCLLIVAVIALLLYFAGQGIVTIFEWLGN